MKVLICDDEYHVIQAIKLLVPWEQLGIHTIFTASSGAEAMELIRQKNPELVITDIVMDDKSGIELMTFIAAQYPSTKVIAVSGHNDFEYVRAMLTKGCTDYLLKPLESDALVQVVEKAVLSWRAEHESSLQHQNLKDQVQSLSNLYSGILLFKMLKAPSCSLYQELVQINPFFATVHSCRIAFYHAGYFPSNYQKGTELLDQLKERCLGYLETSGSGIVLSDPDCPDQVVFFLYDKAASFDSFLEKTAHSVFSALGFPFHMGISSEQEFPILTRKAFDEAVEAFFSWNMDGSSPVLMTADEALHASVPLNASVALNPSDTPMPVSGFSDQMPSSSSRLQETEKEIMSALLTGNQKELGPLIKTWLKLMLPTEDIRLLHIRQVMDKFGEFYEECISMLSKKNSGFRHEPENCLFSYQTFLDKHSLFSRKLLEGAILSDLLLLWEEMKRGTSNTDRMHQIAQYMELNYTKPFVQSQYAKRFYINKDYMCRKFKDTFGVSMLSYLNRIRIEHAKTLLQNPDMKIRDIAYAIGFEDEKYFARQFKKITHMTPGDYRAGL